MSDKEFLQLIFQRMCMIHGENVNYDYMHKFKEIIDNQDDRHIPEGYKLVSIELPDSEKDAARYRHLRESATFGGNQTVDLRWYLPRFGNGLSLEERLDACIDDAIRREAAE